MSITHSDNSLVRSILTKTLTTVSNLKETLDELLIDEKTTLSRLEELRHQVKEMEKTYESLKDLIYTTRLSKEKMEMVAYNLRCRLSPMKTLPMEILLRIFSETIELANKERRAVASKWETPDRDQTCLLLTQVCTRWRSIFSLHPSLWRYCEFNRWADGLDSREREANLLHHSMKQGVLNQQSLFVANWDLEVHQCLLPTLKSFSVGPNALEMDLSYDPAGSWDIQVLKAQCVTVYRGSNTPTCGYISPLLRSAHEVTLCGNPPEWGTLPWVILRTFVLKEFSYISEILGPGISFTREDLSQLLNATPFLENLQLDFKIDETILEWDTNLSITHTHLKSLIVHLHHFVGGKGIFGIQLELPALRTIEFLSIHCHLASAEDEEFICKLNTPTKLILPELESYELQLAAELLRWLPNVKYLDIVGNNANTLLEIARAVYQRSLPLVTPLLSPALTTLHIENTDILGEALVEFVRAKLQHKLAGTEGVSALERIEMYETPGVSMSDWAKIQSLLEEGWMMNGVGSNSH